MKILFIIPCLRRGVSRKYLPVGIGSVMTYCREHGYNFDVLDIDIHEHDDQTVEEYLSKNQYDAVLSGSIVTHYKWMKWMTRTVKKYHPQTKIVIGNSVSSSIPELFLRNSAADVVVIGEGEAGALDVLNAFRDHTSLADVKGIAFLDQDGKFIKTSKREAYAIDSLPMINWDLFDTEKYFSKMDEGSALGLALKDNRVPRVMPVVTARGCAFKCTFCHYVFWDDPYRHRTGEGVMKEIQRDMEKYGATYFNFWDDLSFAGLQQAENIADAILKSGLKFHWDAAVRVDLFGHPRYPYEKRLAVAQKFKDAGCVALGFSLESGNQEILNMMNKKIKAEYYIDQVRLLRKVGISCSTSVVFGYPIETRETIKETFDMCLEAEIYPSIGYLLPLPYTGMYEYAKQHGHITDEDAYLDSITERQDLCINLTKMSDPEIMDCIRANAMELNRKLKLGLTEDRLVKTGGYRSHTKDPSKDSGSAVPEESLEAEELDLNYGKQIFTSL